jgi:hypothetical protein
MRHPLVLVLLCPLVLQTGCATRSKVKNQPSDAGVAATYQAPFAKVKVAARDALAELDFAVREEGILDDHDWRIVASQGITSGTLGRIVRVILEDAGGRVVVRVLVESKLDTDSTSAADGAIADSVHKRIAARL